MREDGMGRRLFMGLVAMGLVAYVLAWPLAGAWVGLEMASWLGWTATPAQWAAGFVGAVMGAAFACGLEWL